MTQPKERKKPVKPHSSSQKNVAPANRLRAILDSYLFGRYYAFFSVVVLAASTTFWALLGASLQKGNADQLVNAYLFDHAATFRAALLPGAHSFLIKWPLFFLIKLVGFSSSAFSLVTVGVVLATVGIFAAILYRIERRPLVIGSLFLALASVLLLVPAQPAAGALLPVNMAMLTTRNIEYMVYIVSLVLVVRAPRLKSRPFWLATVLLGLLIASDKLFQTLAIGSALLALAVYGLLRRRPFVKVAALWLAASVIASAAAVGLLALFNAVGVTHIVNQSNATPYGAAHGLRGIALGCIYAVFGLLTNFGANPAFDGTALKAIPHQASVRLLAPGGISFVVNFVILLAGLAAAGHLVWLRLARPTAYKKNKKPVLADTATDVSILLVASSLVAGAVFIVTNHYYAVDARYLTISLFAVFIAAATFLRGRQLDAVQLVVVGLIITSSMLVGLPAVWRTHTTQRQALAGINSRNVSIAQAISHHPVSVLVGDYWRVLPIKQAAGSKLAVLPLGNCTQPRGVLSSTQWQTDLNAHSFAYILSLDRSLTDYPQCSLSQVQQVYGRPNASVVTAGTLTSPKEILLFYDRGANHSAPKAKPSPLSPSTVSPVALDKLPNLTCSGPTIMNIVAHEDDDLLFMNPDLARDIAAGNCIRTIYVTAGDGGADKFYWLGRERGSEAAYDYMDGPGKDLWVQRTIKLSDHEFITLANPRGNAKISLIFMHLPDGNVSGGGFKSSAYESLARLESGRVHALQAVDGQSTYTAAEMITALVSLFNKYQPLEIRTQANYISRQYPDHSDHMAVGRLVKSAYQLYSQQPGAPAVQPAIKFYIGYPIHAMPANVTGSALAQKQAAFFEYAKFDGGVCATLESCSQTPTYNAYLQRQYQNGY